VAILLFVLLILPTSSKIGCPAYSRAGRGDLPPGGRPQALLDDRLQRYRKALERAHQELKIPFRPGRPLAMQDIYVPLRAGEGGSREAVDAYQAVQKQRWLVVVGAPGAGKSMLLATWP